MLRILKQSKRFTLGVCNCGCNTELKIKNRRGDLARYVKSHNVKDFVKHGSEHPSWTGGRSKMSNGYMCIWNPSHPFANQKGYVYEHRLVMEKHLGRYLTKDEVPHHINGDPSDNRIENLLLLSDKEHRSYETTRMWKEGKYDFRHSH